MDLLSMSVTIYLFLLCLEYGYTTRETPLAAEDVDSFEPNPLIDRLQSEPVLFDSPWCTHQILDLNSENVSSVELYSLRPKVSRIRTKTNNFPLRFLASWTVPGVESSEVLIERQSILLDDSWNVSVQSDSISASFNQGDPVTIPAGSEHAHSVARGSSTEETAIHVWIAAFNSSDVVAMMRAVHYGTTLSTSSAAPVSSLGGQLGASFRESDVTIASSADVVDNVHCVCFARSNLTYSTIICVLFDEQGNRISGDIDMDKRLETFPAPLNGQPTVVFERSTGTAVPNTFFVVWTATEVDGIKMRRLSIYGDFASEQDRVTPHPLSSASIEQPKLIQNPQLLMLRGARFALGYTRIRKTIPWLDVSFCVVVFDNDYTQLGHIPFYEVVLQEEKEIAVVDVPYDDEKEFSMIALRGGYAFAHAYTKNSAVRVSVFSVDRTLLVQLEEQREFVVSDSNNAMFTRAVHTSPQLEAVCMGDLVVPPPRGTFSHASHTSCALVVVWEASIFCDSQTLVSRAVVARSIVLTDLIPGILTDYEETPGGVLLEDGSRYFAPGMTRSVEWRPWTPHANPFYVRHGWRGRQDETFVRQLYGDDNLVAIVRYSGNNVVAYVASVDLDAPDSFHSNEVVVELGGEVKGVTITFMPLDVVNLPLKYHFLVICDETAHFQRVSARHVYLEDGVLRVGQSWTVGAVMHPIGSSEFWLQSTLVPIVNSTNSLTGEVTVDSYLIAVAWGLHFSPGALRISGVVHYDFRFEDGQFVLWELAQSQTDFAIGGFYQSIVPFCASTLWGEFSADARSFLEVPFEEREIRWSPEFGSDSVAAYAVLSRTFDVDTEFLRPTLSVYAADGSLLAPSFTMPYCSGMGSLRDMDMVELVGGRIGIAWSQWQTAPVPGGSRACWCVFDAIKYELVTGPILVNNTDGSNDHFVRIAALGWQDYANALVVAWRCQSCDAQRLPESQAGVLAGSAVLMQIFFQNGDEWMDPVYVNPLAPYWVQVTDLRTAFTSDSIGLMGGSVAWTNNSAEIIQDALPVNVLSSRHARTLAILVSYADSSDFDGDKGGTYTRLFDLEWIQARYEEALQRHDVGTSEPNTSEAVTVTETGASSASATQTSSGSGVITAAETVTTSGGRVQPAGVSGELIAAMVGLILVTFCLMVIAAMYFVGRRGRRRNIRSKGGGGNATIELARGVVGGAAVANGVVEARSRQSRRGVAVSASRHASRRNSRAVNSADIARNVRRSRHANRKSRGADLGSAVYGVAAPLSPLTNNVNEYELVQIEPTSVYDGAGIAAFKELAYSSLIVEDSEVSRGDVIGRGFGGVVYRGEWRDNEVAIKDVQFDYVGGGGGGDGDDDLDPEYVTVRDAFLKEAAAMRSIDPHPNVLPLLAVVVQPTVALITPFCERGSLDSHLYGEKAWELWPVVRPVDARRWLLDISAALAHLHANDIVHRDVAARNILIAADDRLMVTDFGMSRRVQAMSTRGDVLQAQTRQRLGPVKWMAPEQLRDGLYSAASDVWAMAVVALEISAREAPWRNVSNVEAAVQIMDGQLPVMSKALGAKLKTLLLRCFAEHANARPTARLFNAEVDAMDDGDVLTLSVRLSDDGHSVYHKGDVLDNSFAESSAAKAAESAYEEPIVDVNSSANLYDEPL